jgi:hypothetical protein
MYGSNKTNITENINTDNMCFMFDINYIAMQRGIDTIPFNKDISFIEYVEVNGKTEVWLKRGIDKVQFAKYKKNNNFIPDTTVNRSIILDNETSILKVFGDIMDLLLPDTEHEFPRVYFKNKTGTQFLKMILYPGGFNNYFTRFVIGDIAYFPQNEEINNSKFNDFYTESGIHIGISTSDLLKIKGYNCIITSNDNMQLYIYPIYSDEDDYHWAYYTAYYWFKNDKLVKFEYGFEPV